MNLIEQFALAIALEIGNLTLRTGCPQLPQIIFERDVAVDSRLPFSQQIQIRPVDDLNFFHTLFFIRKYAIFVILQRTNIVLFLRISPGTVIRKTNFLSFIFMKRSVINSTHQEVQIVFLNLNTMKNTREPLSARDRKLHPVKNGSRIREFLLFCQVCLRFHRWYVVT